MKKFKVGVVGSNYYSSYYKPFDYLGPQSDDVDKDLEIGNIGLLVFTGGEDVDPSMYEETTNYLTGSNIKRDLYEKRYFDIARKNDIPMAGICRGGQFLCAMSGGKLIQHLDGHGRYHDLMTDDGETIFASSTHHQCQLPPKDAIPVAWSKQRLSKRYLGGPGVEYTEGTVDREHDVVYYPSTRSLGCQYHSEYHKRDERAFTYMADLLERFFGFKK